MFRFRLNGSDDTDEDFKEIPDEEEAWEDACCEDPYWEDDDDEPEEREWCD